MNHFTTPLYNTAPIKETIPFHTTITRQQSLKSRVNSYPIVGVTITRQQCLKSRIQKLHNCRRQTSRCPSDGYDPREKEAEEAQSSYLFKVQPVLPPVSCPS
ncbi:hypothetical protein Pcinc_005710 [Petrolisthes cinctipes]|uniref:Uncharacterized protein n=1 Tax=Petrolisthes cinctipes TaxID=88211 RepID=A0AAE1GIR7_PETCI|nr:hypothetical protein Pcinc_005710 [Petrolisthes cinctipes]